MTDPTAVVPAGITQTPVAAAVPGGVVPGQSAPVDPLAGLRDWHLPDPVSWWPPAPGWWLLAALLLVLAVVLRRWWLVRRRRGAPIRAAVSELTRLRRSADSASDPRGFAAAVSSLLRRLALVRYPRERVAGLTGNAWLAFLAETGGGDGFTTGAGRVLAELPYRGGPQAGQGDGVEIDALSQLSERWIKAQRGVTR